MASDVVITCIVPISYRDASVLFDRSSTYSYMSSYFASCLDMTCDFLVTPIYVSTPIRDSIVIDHVYHSCVVTIGGYERTVDLLFLNIVDFDVILGMDWLSKYHAILDCHAKTVTLAMPGFPMFEWRGSLCHIPSRVVSFLKAQRMVGKGCLLYLAFVRDISADTPTIDSVPIIERISRCVPCRPTEYVTR
ncbi:uncharacterized protein [Nicotiana tomentosiformis]|uniref:uncharacterized protein n=1 Tax=Nicotiana tomentosiformis TaxID=4098 RepID=UPI00388C8073